MATKADAILKEVLTDLGLDGAKSDVVYGRIGEIVSALKVMNAAETISVSTTGTITERICEHGLRAACPDSYEKLGKDWKWIGDFFVKGAPFNTVITVKSFKAKERLLSSGTGNLLSPTIGYGLFDDPKEWSETRVASYVFRAFFAIYMPDALLVTLPHGVREKKNINGRPFLRTVESFIGDVQSALSTKGLLDPRRL